MICERCNQRESTLHSTLIIEGGVKKLDWCGECLKTHRAAFLEAHPEEVRGRAEREIDKILRRHGAKE